MTEQNQDTAQEKTAEDSFAEFESEVYDGGELVDEPADAPTKEQNPPSAKPEADQPAGDVVDVGEADGEAAPELKEGEQPKKKQTAQERINELTRARHDAERRAVAAEERLRQIEQAAPPKKEEPKPAAPAADPNEPNPDDFDYGEMDPRFIRALASYETKKIFDEQREADRKELADLELSDKQQAARGKLVAMVERAEKTKPDFFEKVVTGAEAGDWPLSTEIGELALASDVGDEVLYHLASNVQEAAAIFRQTPLEQARSFGRLEAKFSAEQAAASGDTGKPAPKTSKAPAPIPSARGAGGQSQADADTDDFLAFEQRTKSRS